MTAVLLITICLFLGYAILIIYYRQSWTSIPAFIPLASAKKPSVKITVIIPARNEELHIKACLDSICRQTYPVALFEIIVVDDHSTDNTAFIIEGYARENIKCIALKDHVDTTLNAYKKKAIEVAIGQSTGDLIVTTDADCVVPTTWLQTIASFYETYHPAFIAAPVVINTSGNFIQLFQTIDFMTLQGITGASVFKNFHMMCNGANLAYEKTAFTKVDGFLDINDIASGDDMLLMYKIYKQYPERIKFIKSKDLIVQTAPVRTIGQFFNQRIRWASKADKYEDKKMLPVLLLVYFLNLSLLALPIIAVFDRTTIVVIHFSLSIIELWLLVIVLKTLVELFFLYPVATFFGKKNILWWFPILQPFHIIYTVIAGFWGKFGNYNWKGRQVK